MTRPLTPKQAYALWAADYPASAHNPFMRAEERAMLSLIPASLRGLDVLDAGCGSGRYLDLLVRRHPRELVGIDLSPEMLSRADHVHLAAGDLLRLPVRDQWADLSLCSLTIGHVAELSRALEELVRVTKPGGRLLISDLHPGGRELDWRRTFKVEDRTFEVEHHYHSVSDWETEARRLGCHIETCRHQLMAPEDWDPPRPLVPPLDSRPAILALSLRVGSPSSGLD